MGDRDLERAGREMLALEALAEIAVLKEELAGYQLRYGSFESVEASANAIGSEDFERDDAYLDWRSARERLAALDEKLRSLIPHAA